MRIALALLLLSGCGGDPESPDAGGPPSMDAGGSDAGCERAVEICGDFMDQNCDGRDTGCGDTDGDGVLACRPGEAPPACDCDDAQAGSYPARPGLAGGAEACDGRDNDCDGRFDEAAECCAACTALGDADRGDVCTSDGTCDCSSAAGLGPCPAGQTCCASGCVDISSDFANCGICGTQCTTSSDRCTAGNCTCGTMPSCEFTDVCTAGACQ